jgi:EAL domain-containing protein (putative c-di-GMP-specific phosphodiesterase class I)/FixJ family two-component response regulator
MFRNDGMRVLLVDDDPALVRAYRSALQRFGMAVETAANGRDAIERVKRARFDVVLSDISMPHMSGLELLEAVRAHDVDVPVILMTGEPGVDSAMRAVEHGAFRYLTKPVDLDKLRDTVGRAAKLHMIAKLKREASELRGDDGERIGERAALETRFSAALAQLWMAFQPIVSVRDKAVFGFEALLRSDEPMMKNPAHILDAAERLDRLLELGRTIRRQVAAAAAHAPEGARLFVNLHSADLNDEELYAPEAPLSRIAGRVVLEVTERASLHDVKNVNDAVARLKMLGYRIAIDDLGAGYAGLTSFTQLDPELAKLDMSLVRGIDGDARLQTIVRSMKLLCDELGILVVAEGVETDRERNALAELGCELLQGYLFARPERAFREPRL